MKNPFILNDVESQTLIGFEQASSLEALAQLLGKDPTVISKQLKRIAEKTDFLTKISGRWSLTDLGRRYIQITRDYILAQNSLREEKVQLRIGTNREFSSRIVSRGILELQRLIPNRSITLKTYERGVEDALLHGEIDIGLDCGRPHSPEIAYKRVVNESILPVASKAFIKSRSIDLKRPDLASLPHILCDRLHPERVTGESDLLGPIVLTTNDLASTRETCLQGLGWALLPKYAIHDELESGKLIALGSSEYRQEKYGVWMLRARKYLQTEFEACSKWLTQRTL